MVNARNKGKVGESEFINRFNMFFPNELKRNLLQTREGGADISGCHPFQIEIKRCEKIEKKKWWGQIRKACKDEEIPVVGYRQNRGSWKFLLPVNLFLDGHDGFMEVEEEIWLKFIMDIYRD